MMDEEEASPLQIHRQRASAAMANAIMQIGILEGLDQRPVARGKNAA